MKNKPLHKLFLHDIQDLYSAEKQILEEIPKMIREAKSEKLLMLLQKHLEQTQTHIDRLEEIKQSLNMYFTSKVCKGMQGIIEENGQMLKEGNLGEATDAAIIAGAQKVEHYEIAMYGTVLEYAQIMKHDAEAELLQKTLDEEDETDQELSEIAQEINKEANIED